MADNIINENGQAPSNFKGYLLIWIGQSVSLLGSQVVQFAIIWWITLETESAFMLSLSTFLGLIPMVLLGPIAGVIVDRWDRKLILIVTDFLQAIATLGLIYLFILDIVEVYHVLILITIRGVFQALQMPASIAIVPQLVPKHQISRINALNMIVNNILLITSPVIGALLIEFWDVGTILWVDVVTFIIAALTLLFVVIPSIIHEADETTEKSSFRQQFGEGLSFIKESHLIPLLVVFLALNIVFNPLFALLPLFVTDVHSGGAGDLALLSSLFQVGLLVGSIIIAIGKLPPRVKIMSIAATSATFGLLVIALSPTGAFWLMGCGALLIGFSIAFIDVQIISLLQIIVPAELQGRVMSTIFTTIKSILPIALLGVGILAELTELTFLFLIAPMFGFLILAYAVFIARINGLDNLLKVEMSNSFNS